MPAFTLGEIMSQGTARVGRRADIPLSDASFWANVAYLEVADAIPFALQERIAISSTTSGENRFDLPSDCGEPLSLQLTSIAASSTTSTGGSIRTDIEWSYTTLRLTSIAAHDARGHLPGGTPTEFAFYNNWLELWPSPDSGYSLQLRYRSLVTDMLATTEVPSISTPWRPAILLRFESFLHEYLGNDAAAAQSFNRYLAFVNTKKTDEARRQMLLHGGYSVAPSYETPRARGL